MKFAVPALFLLMTAVPATADTVNPGFIGCVSEDALDEFTTAVVREDKRHMGTLLGSVCVPIGGLDYSMVDQGFIVSEIRVYVGNDSVNLFTPAEATR